MWLTFAVLIGIVASRVRSASLLSFWAPSFSASPQGQGTDNQALNEQLVEAVRAGDTEKTRALLRSGANADYGRGLPLTVAVDRNDTTIARILVEAGAQLNRGDNPSPLATAVAGDHLETIRLLLSLGANVNGTGPPVDGAFYESTGCGENTHRRRCRCEGREGLRREPPLRGQPESIGEGTRACPVSHDRRTGRWHTGGCVGFDGAR